MNRYIKVRFVKDGEYTSDSTHIFKTDLDVQLGEIVQATPLIQEVVAGFTTIDMIADPTNVKNIVGQIKKEEVHG
ncbi:MAG TPA: hypothetical protein VN258_06465 [Mobilitalea sp.]|nr:hypothetical protein [Mobilitalea sp.]